MPAVTVDDILVVPRVSDPDRAATKDRPVLAVTTAPSAFEGEGFPVRRAFAGVDLQALDPFIHMDQMGEVNYAPGEPKGTSWHPHRGFETVTYIIDGTFRHQDSNGGGGLITNGDTQWMTAGGGILHIEESPDGGTLVRVIAGEVAGYAGPGITHTPISLLHATLQPGAQLRLPWRGDFNALGYVMAGSGSAGAGKRPVRIGQLAVFGPGDVLTFEASPRSDGPAESMELLVLGGQPIREPVAAYGPFVMNTRAELVQAFEDYQAGRLGTIPAKRADIPAEPHPGHDVL